MLTDDDIVSIDKLLREVGEPTLTDRELNMLQADDATAENIPCDYIKYASIVTESRYKYSACPIDSIKQLDALADANQCDFDVKQGKDDLLIPLYAMGISM